MYKIINQNFHLLLISRKLIPILLFIFFICGCNQKRGEDFVKLETPLEEALPKITLTVPDIEDNNNDEPIEITVGNSFEGIEEYSIHGDETQKIHYTYHKLHTIEGNKYIFSVVSYNFGGTGTFYYLTAVDKTMLKSVDEVLLGDRIIINKVKLDMPNSDTVTISYTDRKLGTAMTEKPDNPVEKHFGMDKEKFSQYWIEKLE